MTPEDKELIERLREFGHHKPADAIERMSAENKELREVVQMAHDNYYESLGDEQSVAKYAREALAKYKKNKEA